MQNSRPRKFFATLSITVFILGQFALISTGLLVPKPAEAFIPGFTTTLEIGNTYDVLKDIGLGALKAVALELSNKFLTKLTNQLQSKYKIRNYLYYDRVLSDYYLNRYIADKITDPDLRQIYSLFEKGIITGESTGTTGPDPRKALIPRLKQAIAKQYQKQGGVDPNQVFNPVRGTDDLAYFRTAQAYFSNPPGFTEQNLQTEYGSFQSSATTAAQFEIVVGNGLKAGRIIGGTCNTGDTIPSQPELVNTPEKCRAFPGTWQQSALDVARSFIDNPTATVDKYLTSAIQTKIDKNFDPNSFWAVIGSLVGSFLFNQLTLDKPGGTLPDDPTYYYQPPTDDGGTGTPIDFDGDGITDGYDINDDDVPDVCVYGGVDVLQADGSVISSPGPPCKGSVAARTTTPPPTPQGPCTQKGRDMADYGLDLLNNQGLSPEAAVGVINQEFNLGYGEEAVVAANNTIGLVEFYFAGPTDERPTSPTTGEPWDVVWRCSSGNNNGPTITCEQTPSADACSAPNHEDVVTRVKNYVVAQGINITGFCGAFEITKRVAWALRGEGAGLLTTNHSGQCNGLASGIISYTDDSEVDILSDEGAANRPQWLPAPGNPEAAVHYTAAIDPGDPEGSY